jgi:hypothetical protein
MKRTILLLLIALLVGIISCKDEDVQVADASDFKAVMNDESWTSNTSWANYSQTEHTFYVNATHHDPRFYRDEQLTISFEMADLSKPATITQFSSQWYSIIGGKDLASRFYLDNSASNQVKIITIDPERKVISGSFKLRLVSDSGDGVKSVQYLEGHFSMEYNEIE